MQARSRRSFLILVALAILVLLALLARCACKGNVPSNERPSAADAPSPSTPSAAADPVTEPEEVLTPATLQVPSQVDAGASFRVTWTGPDNRGDYVTIVPADAPESVYGHYRETREGKTLELVAPVEPGACEVRYVTGRGRAVLGRAPIVVAPIGVTLDAEPEAVLGASIRVSWTGPDNQGDYVTVVPREASDGHYEAYTATSAGSPLSVTAPSVAGEAEVRYVSGQGGKVLARRPIRILMPDVSLLAPADAIAGTTIEVAWTGPDNPGDYVTVVAEATPDGQYGNYTATSKGSPLPLLTPIMDGVAELRYVTGQGGKVLARRAIRIVAAEVTLSAPDEAAAGSMVSVDWTGPDNPGDYVTVVAREEADGKYGNYVNTSSGSPLSLKLPPEPGECELRYMTGQGGKVLARRPITVVR